MLFLNPENLNPGKLLSNKVKLKAKKCNSKLAANLLSGFTVPISFISVFISVFILSGNMVYASGIKGTAHDLSSKGFSAGENCIICHTPHNSDISLTVTPLWNNQPGSSTFNMYFTEDETITTQPTGVSKLCLSCHDGVTAIDSFGGQVSATFIGDNPAANISIEQTDSHPLSITFDSAMAAKNPSLYDPAIKKVTIGAGGENAQTGTIAELLLPNGKVQCSSCHDVHNNLVGPGDKNQPFLKITKAGSEICMTCHNK